MSFVCPTCKQEFARAAQLKTHGERKRPCKPPVLTEPKPEEEPKKPDEFRPASVKFNKELSKEVRQATGIFFTPKKARDLLFETLEKLDVPAPASILEPSYGTGEFLLDAAARYPGALLQGVEMNKDLFQSMRLTAGNWFLTNGDFLDWSGNADLIIGNPPYFVVPVSSSLQTTKGRPNIYITFLHKCLSQHLNPDGHLAFIIPTSLYNCSYYQPMRDYIAANTTIRHVETLNRPGFYETGQETMLLILQKKVPVGADFLFKAPNGHTYISPDYKELYNLTKDATTVGALGLGVKTGNVVWNQHKEALADEGTLLIYSSNIHEGKLVFPVLKAPKKQYIQLDKPVLEGPNLLVERGYGNGYLFQYVLIDQPCYAENHVNVIYPRTPDSSNLERVVKSFQDPRTAQFLKYFIGNGSLSATELETLFPIFNT
jgi:hypothetical protein